MSETIKYLLPEAEMPKNWYNIVADLPEPPPPVIHPGTGQPIGPDDLAPLFPMDLILQEVTSERFIDVPRPVLDIYRQWRPRPLFRARRLEKVPNVWMDEQTSPGRPKHRVPKNKPKYDTSHTFVKQWRFFLYRDY